MSDDLREKIARACAESEFTVLWGDLSEHEKWMGYHRADAVLAVLPSEGWEQVGGLCVCGLVATEDMVPSGDKFGHSAGGPDPEFCGPVEPVYIARRVDGAAPPSAIEQHNAAMIDAFVDAMPAERVVVEAVVDGAAPPEPEAAEGTE